MTMLGTEGSAPARSKITHRRRTAGDRFSLPSFAIPTLVLFFGSFLLWVVAALAVIDWDLSRWWLALTVPVQALVTYAMFTVLHESIHYTVGRPKWLNEMIGRCAMPFVALWATYPTMTFIHLEHHQHANEHNGKDPDAWATAGPRWLLPLRWLSIDGGYAVFYLRHMKDRPRREKIWLVVNHAVVVAASILLVAAGYGTDLVLLYLIPQRIGMGLLACWFDWLPHHGLRATPASDRFGVARLRVGHEWLLNLLLIGQNYHLLHHIDPMTPFYRYVKKWRQNEADYLNGGVVITTLWGRELTSVQYRSRRPVNRGEPGADCQVLATTDRSSMATVTLDGVTTRFATGRYESLLDAALRAGVAAPYLCTGGICGACRAKLVSGSVEMAFNRALSDVELAEGWVLACQSRISSGSAHVDFDAWHHPCPVGSKPRGENG